MSAVGGTGWFVMDDNQADGANDSDVPRILPYDPVTWTYQVTNTGEVALSEAEIAVTDDQPGVTPVGPGDSILSPGETWIYTATGTAVDLTDPPEGVLFEPGCDDNRNTYVNVGSVEVNAGGETASDSDSSHYCNPGNADIDIRKQAEGPDTQSFPSGSDVTFDIEVTNMGTVDLNNVAVSDANAPGCDNNIGFLAAGDSVKYTCTELNVTNSFENVASVAGESYEGILVGDDDPSTVEIIDIDIRKQEEGLDTSTFTSGSDVPFEIVVTNTGDEDMSNVVVTDVLVPACDRNIGDLVAGASIAYTCTAPTVTLSFDNEVCVNGERDSASVQDCDPSTVEIEPRVVSIDIKPGSDPNSINPRSKGVIPVAILGTDSFDATKVNALSVGFGSDGANETHGQGHVEDVDGDGYQDTVLHFRTQETGIACGDTEATLTGQAYDGIEISGKDSIKTVGCKKK